MTYQEKIEILSGTMYDHDDYCDNLPNYFDYDEPYDWEELHGFDGPVEYGMCSDPCKSDVSGGETILSELGSVACQMVMCPHRNSILPGMETDQSLTRLQPPRRDRITPAQVRYWIR